MPFRTLYIGLGGTGAKSILQTKKCFIDAYGEVPPMVSFLAIDTDTAIKELAFTSRNGKSVKFDDNEICYCEIIMVSADVIKFLIDKHPTQYQWFPTRNMQVLNNLCGFRAGQIRSNGRFLARYNGNYIQEQISNKLDQLSNAEMPDKEYIQVHIVGSAAGGTGSGMFLDIMLLVAKILRERKCAYTITPWILLPDVFRHMAPGVPTAHTFMNAYGLLEELDYLYHLSQDNQQPIDFHFDQVYHLDDHIEGAYLINNTNDSGVIFLHVDELAELMGRSMYLKALEDSRCLGLYDILNHMRRTEVYSCDNKEAHYASIGYAEIIYDSQAIANVIARGIVGKICMEMCHSDATDILNATNEEIILQNGYGSSSWAEQLINGILPKCSPTDVVVGKRTNANIIYSCIQEGALGENVKKEATNNAKEEFNRTTERVLKQVQQILNTQNGVAQTIAFLESLLENISRCKFEVDRERLDLQKLLADSINWDNEISALRKRFLIFFKYYDADLAELLQTKISDRISQHRDLLRHNLVIQFFTDLELYVNELLDKINVFKINLEAVERKQRAEIASIQHWAQSTSHFEIYLHSNEVCNYTLPNGSETFTLLRQQENILDLIDKSQDELSILFINLAKKHQDVQAAANITIEQKMVSMPEEKLKEVLICAKNMSAPLWKTKTLDCLDGSQKLTSMFLIGVSNNSSSIISDRYNDDFVAGTNRPTFISTYQTDRISIFQQQYYTPLFTVANVLEYKKEAERRLSHEHFPVHYLDEQWHRRMLDEGFEIEPHQQEDRILLNWINAIVYGFIKYDETQNTYFINSITQGDRLRAGFLALGERRDQAFEQFELRGLDKEVDERIQQMILDKGHSAITEVIKNVKENLANYVTDYAQLSQTERNRIEADDQAYQMVSNLLIREITYLNDLVL